MSSHLSFFSFDFFHDFAHSWIWNFVLFTNQQQKEREEKNTFDGARQRIVKRISSIKMDEIVASTDSNNNIIVND